MNEIIEKSLIEHAVMIDRIKSSMIKPLQKVSERMIARLEEGGKIFFFGNGGSAADAQHLAAELTGRYQLERKGLPAIALTTDSSALTAIGNDFGFASLFVRQVEALATSKDVLVGISTSGTSQNVLRALALGKEKGCYTVGICGENSTEMQNMCEDILAVPSSQTPRIQEIHILYGHILCDCIDQYFAKTL